MSAMNDEWLRGRSERLTGRIQVRTEKDWVVAAVQSREVFESGLRAIGLPETEVARAVFLRDETHSRVRAIDAEIVRYRQPGVYYAFDPVPADLYVQRNSAWQRLADWFKGREVRVLETTSTEVRVPLFVLSSADVEGCTAAFNLEEMQGRNLSWNMTIYGNGVGGAREFAVSAVAGFTAAAGQIKVVFVPVLLALQRVVVLEAGRQIGSGVQIDGSSVHTNSSPGLLVLPPGTGPPAGLLVRRFPLAGDTTGALATYQWVYKRTSRLHTQIGLDVFGGKLSMNVGTELTTQVTLTYGLRGGYDYVLLGVAQGDGLLWALPALPMGGDNESVNVDGANQPKLLAE